MKFGFEANPVIVGVVLLTLVILLLALFGELTTDLPDAGTTGVVKAIIEDSIEVYSTDIKAESADLKLEFLRYANQTGQFKYKIESKLKLKKEIGIGVTDEGKPVVFGGLEYGCVGLKAYAFADKYKKAHFGLGLTYKF